MIGTAMSGVIANGGEPIQTVSRYVLQDLVGSGGMARVYVGFQQGVAGFTKAVAIKRLHPDLASDPTLGAALLDEAHITSNIRHPNVVSTSDVVREGGEFLLVMDYVVGVPLDVLLRRSIEQASSVPDGVVSALMLGILAGLHAAHEGTDVSGRPLGIVHRDISPHNVLVDEMGNAKVLDFGIAKAHSRLMATTQEGTVKGKPAYIAPEQLGSGAVDRRADIYSAGVILWELLVGRRYRAGMTLADLLRVVGDDASVISPADVATTTAARLLGEVAVKAMRADPDDRFPSASSMAQAIEARVAPSSSATVIAWVQAMAGDVLEQRRALAVPRVTVPRAEEHAPEEATAVLGAAAGMASSPTARRRPRLAAALGGIVALLVAIVATPFAWSHRTRGGETTTAVADSPPPMTPVDAAVGEAPQPMASAPTLTTAQPPTPGAATSRAMSVAPGAPRGTSRSRRKSDRIDDRCRVPFEIDANGVKIPKRECL